ncbi:MAG: cell division protein FtsA [Lachnospiraceae bacterium]
MVGMTKYPEPLVFGLDIGTRSIVGTVGYREGSKFNIVAQCVKFHDTRAMLDGQIHDINKVGEEIIYVKENLEEQLSGRKLTDVCIAAAGRVLKTSVGKAMYEFNENTVVNQEYIHSLEMLGVEKAHEQIFSENDSEMKFFCVGYTVIKYYLNGYEISNLEGHKARNISADVLATFLPEEVVDGLYAAVQIAGLEISNMTLEPIAAIQVAIPENYRLLNIALVDVGAGTSDISITKDGSIIGYGMLPKAGDELTECLIKEYLVDFDTAEKIKAIKENTKNFTYKDIMGISHKITPAEVYEKLEPIVDDITKQIAERILSLNGGKTVSAAFVVGGGGKIPFFTKMLAKHLGILEERVALRGEEVLGFVNILVDDVKKDPLLVTPIGICLNFYEQKNRFVYLMVNKDRVKLYDNDKLTVFDAALAYGLSNESIFPKRGKDLNFTLNGKPKFIRGKSGEPASILLNGEEVGLNHFVKAGDQIEVTESTIGEDAKVLLKDIVKLDNTISIIVNDVQIVCPQYATVNGNIETESYELKEGDQVQLLNYYSLSQLMQFMDIETPHEVFVNGARASADTRIYENFNVAWIDREEIYLAEKFVTEELTSKEAVEDKKNVFKDENASLLSDSSIANEKTPNNSLENRSEKNENYKQESFAFLSDSNKEDDNALSDLEQNPEPSSGNELVNQWIMQANQGGDKQTISVTVNSKKITLSGKTNYVFVDIFDKYEFDLHTVKGSTLIQKINGEDAQHFSPLSDGAIVELYWKE